MGNLTKARLIDLAERVATLVGVQPGGMRSVDIVKELAKEDVSQDDAANSIVYALDDGLIRLGTDLKYFSKAQTNTLVAA